ncbi:septum formation initiator [Ruania alkalisoli]|uniref:Septum formation initiator n=1 Tax=Ruania alkalisoli TaxID=2779775 RepID=A0A7M1SWC4_9MICO|nr:septum site-determining protein Ssd [Ruania alkalisoli]QOR71347.1 septum formation initiator [Ruania alkalisoli]
MSQDEPIVALRSARTDVIDAVREVVALADRPVVVHPPGAGPAPARLLVDSLEERTPEDPLWVRPGSRSVAVRMQDADVSSPALRRTHASGEGRPLQLPADAQELLTLVRTAARERRAKVIGVVGARGGAGASCLAAALARTAVDRGLGTALADLDTCGAGVDLLLGIEHSGGLRWADLSTGDGSLPHDQLAAALPSWGGVRVLSADWRGGPDTSQGSEALDALAAGHDLLVLDLPRAQAVWAGMCDVVYVVTTCDVMSGAAARMLAAGWQGGDLRLVVRGPAPGGLTAAEVAQACGLTLAVSMREERSLAAALERGVAPGENRRGPLRRGALAALRDLDLVDE